MLKLIFLISFESIFPICLTYEIGCLRHLKLDISKSNIIFKYFLFVFSFKQTNVLDVIVYQRYDI